MKGAIFGSGWVGGLFNKGEERRRRNGHFGHKEEEMGRTGRVLKMGLARFVGQRDGELLCLQRPALCKWSPRDFFAAAVYGKLCHLFFADRAELLEMRSFSP